MKKRMLVFTVLLFLLTGTLMFTASAADIVDSGNCGTDGDNLRWVLTSDHTLTISGNGDMANYRDADGERAPWYSYAESITTAVVESGITSIGNTAFLCCHNLANLTIPNSVTAIGSFAFAQCGFATLTIPNSVKTIGDAAFISSNIESVIIPDGVTKIQAATFQYCSRLKSVTIPASVTVIEGAFYLCELSNVYYAGTREQWVAITIGDGNETLTNAEIICQGDIPPEIIASGYCGDTDIRLDGTNLSWTLDSGGILTISGKGRMNEGYVYSPWHVWQNGKGNVFYQNDIKTVRILDGVVDIGTNAFTGCKNITSITIPNSVTLIHDNAFLLKEPTDIYYSGTYEQWLSIDIDGVIFDSNVNIHCKGDNSSITTVASGYCGNSHAAAGVKNAAWILYDNGMMNVRASYNISAGSTGIPSWSEYRDQIKELRIAFATSINGNTFSNCENLTRITMPASTVISAGAFANCNKIAYIKLTGGKMYQHETSSADPRPNKNAPWYLASKTEHGVTVEIGDYVSSISEDAFYGCDNINVIISDNVSTIGMRAFCNSGITSIVFPSHVKTLGWGTFYHCRNLKDVTISEGAIDIGSCTFYECVNLTSVTIPNSVTNIGNGAFYGCIALASIALPNSLTNIGKQAFEDCTNLADIFYAGTVTEWNAISKNSDVPQTTTVHCLAEPLSASEKFNISQENAQWTLAVGEELTLNVQKADGSDFDTDQLVWKIESGNGQSVAEIADKGKTGEHSAYAVVRGLYPGKATLVAEMPSSTGLIDINQPRVSQQITVVEPKGVWFSTTASQYVVGCGQSIGIAAFIDGLTGEDTNRVTWSIADSGNASVEKGLCLVTDVSTGLVKAGATVYGHVTGLTSVTVTAPDGRSATIPLLVSNAQDIQRLIITPTASGSVDSDDASESQSADWAWDKDSGSLEIKGSGAIPDYASYDETPWAKYRNEIKFVTLCDGITAVGKNAFRNCMALQEVSIPKTLVSISENAFDGDSKLNKVKWAGTPAEWDALKQNMASGNEPLQNLKRSQIEMYQDADKVPVNSAYNATEYQKTWKDKRDEKWNTLKESIDQYISKVKSDAESKSSEANAQEDKIKGYSDADIFDKFRGLKSVKDIEKRIKEQVDSAPNSFKVFSDDRKAEITKAAVKLFYEELKKGEEKKFRDFQLGAIDLKAKKIGKVDFSLKLIEIQFIENTRQYLVSNLTSQKLFAGTTERGDTVELCYNVMDAGYYLRVIGKDVDDEVRDFKVWLALPDNTIEEMTTQYMSELCAKTKEVMKKALTEYMKYLDKITGFSDAFKAMEKESVRSTLESLLEKLGLEDKWKFVDNAYQINEIYRILKPVVADHKNLTPEKLKAIGEELQSLESLTVSNATDKIVGAINGNVQSFIEEVLFNPGDSLTNSEDKIVKQFWESAKEKYPLVTDGIEYCYNRIKAKCPVDFRIYDADGRCIGYVENGVVWHNDTFLIEVNGECKTVYIPSDMEIRFEFTGTGDGAMTYVMEEVRNGVIIGRKNYYDIPLTEGASYTQTFTTGSDLTSLQTNPVISADGDSISANEYLDAKDESLEASVYVDCIVEGAGTVTGFGNFPKGNAVSLFACPEDEMEFVGWSENGVLVSADSLYQFAARENRELHALFRKPYEENDKYEISVNDEYPYSVGLAVYQDEDALAHIAITPLSSQDTTSLSQVKAKRYRLDGKLYAEQTLDAAYDLKYSYWLPATDISECAKLELFDKSEQLIAVLFSEEWDAKNPPTLSYRNLQRSADRVSLTAEISNPSSADVSGQIIVAAYNSDGKMLNCSIIPDISLTTNSEAENSVEITCQGNGNTATVKLFFLDDAWVPLASALAVT